MRVPDAARRSLSLLTPALHAARAVLRARVGSVSASICIAATLGIAAAWSTPVDDAPLTLDLSSTIIRPSRLDTPPARPGVQLTRDGLLAGIVRLGDGPALPVLGVKASDLRDSYGNPRSGERRHAGIDIGAPMRTPVAAAMDGWIASMSWSEFGGRGLHIVDRTGTWLLYYAHLDEYAEGLYNGQAVRRGELIGYVGTTGNARGWPHLHFEAGRLARPGSLAASPVNPYDFLLGRNPLPRPLRTVADTIALPPEPAVPPLLPPG